MLKGSMSEQDVAFMSFVILIAIVVVGIALAFNHTVGILEDIRDKD